jgi:hypothetical protein
MGADGLYQAVIGYAFKIDMVFDVANDLIGIARGRCSPSEQRTCTVTQTILNSLTQAQVNALKDYCEENKCPFIVTAFQAANDNVQDADLHGKDFSVALADYTGLEPLETGALMSRSVLDEKGIAACGAISYSTSVYQQTPSRNCTKYENLHCGVNHYTVKETPCVEPDSKTNVRALVLISKLSLNCVLMFHAFSCT